MNDAEMVEEYVFLQPSFTFKTQEKDLLTKHSL